MQLFKLRIRLLYFLKCSLVIGGMDKEKNYIDDVEIFAPGYTCHEEKWREDNPGRPNFPAFKYPVVGPSGIFINGKILICGGALQRYEDCVGEGPRYCKRNRECVETDGGAQWCTGPKTNECRGYK